MWLDAVSLPLRRDRGKKKKCRKNAQTPKSTGNRAYVGARLRETSKNNMRARHARDRARVWECVSTYLPTDIYARVSADPHEIAAFYPIKTRHKLQHFIRAREDKSHAHEHARPTSIKSSDPTLSQENATETCIFARGRARKTHKH